MGYFAGIDLGKRKSRIKVITSERKVIEELTIENDPKTFVRVFKKYRGDIDVACEASSNAFWVADVLSPIVRKVHVGHTSKIRWIAEARIKTDKIDAGILAELLRADLQETARSAVSCTGLRGASSHSTVFPRISSLRHEVQL